MQNEFAYLENSSEYLPITLLINKLQHNKKFKKKFKNCIFFLVLQY